MRKTVRAWVVLAAGGFPAALLGVSEPRLVADLATVPSPYEGSKPHGLTTIGAQVVFAAQPDDHSDRLFRSDGTPTGTSELAAPCAVRERGTIALMYAGSARAFYAVSCGDRAAALWATDGTVAGTTPLLGATEFQRAWPFYSAPGWVEDGARTLFLQGGNYASPLELWSTDGTSSGTIRLAILSAQYGATGALASRANGALQLLVWEHFASLAVWESDGTVAGTALATAVDLGTTSFGVRSFASTESGIFFVLELGNPGAKELWLSDGTGAGTLRLATFDTGVWDDLVVHAGAIYFSASAGGAAGIWRSDGTIATTRRIAALENLAISPASFTFLNERIYCLGFAQDWSSGSIYSAPVSGGSPEELLQQCVGDYCYPLYENLWLETVGDRLVFSRREPGVSAVWSSDGVFGGTPLEIAPLCSDTECGWTGFPPVVQGDELLFVRQRSGLEALELWRSGGTADSTFRIAGPFPALTWTPSGGESPIGSLPGDDGWLFAAGDEVHGHELWRARRQEDSGVLVADLRLDRPRLEGLEAIGLVEPDLVFALQNPDSTRTLYRHQSGGDAVEPFLTLPVIRGRYGSRNPAPTWRIAGDAWYFFESDFDGDQSSEDFAQQVWRYDPVSRDVRALFAEIGITGIGALAHDLWPSQGDFLLLGGRDALLQPAIYRLRPASGTISKLMELPAAHAATLGRSGNSWFLIEDRSRLVVFDLARRTREVLVDFTGGSLGDAIVLPGGALIEIGWSPYSGDGRVELWQSDGSAEGTRELGQWTSQVECSSWIQMPPSADRSVVLFAVEAACGSSHELWISDGSAERTGRLRTFPDGEALVEDGGTRFRGEIYFLGSAREPVSDVSTHSIWKTDGTPGGTVPIVELPSGYAGSPNALLGMAGAAGIYFPWGDLSHGMEFWRTDGTASGTGLLADLEPGAHGSSPFPLWAVGDQVLFAGWTSANGTELWQVDGGLDTPQRVADLYPGPENADPLIFAASDERLYFLADDGIVGREIWEVDEPSVASCVASPTTLCLSSGRFRARAVRRDFAGELGAAGVVPLTADSGYFWFFDEGNPEVMLKIVDACGLPGFENFWSYSTGLTNVEVELEVVDTVTGERKNVRTALGTPFSPDFDSGAFQVCDGAAVFSANRSTEALPRTAEPQVLPLLDGRFEATATWATLDGKSGAGRAVAISGDSGYFWFFAPSIVEVLVKMVDACGYPGFDNFWVFAGGLTDVEVHLTVTDTWSGEVVRHDNLQGQPFPTLLEAGRLRVCAASNSVPAARGQR